MVSDKKVPENEFHQWKDCEQLFIHLGADVSKKNSRLRIILNHRKAIFHCPNSYEKIDKYSLIALQKLLEYAGKK